VISGGVGRTVGHGALDSMFIGAFVGTKKDRKGAL
jgi:hypothetical protein